MSAALSWHSLTGYEQAPSRETRPSRNNPLGPMMKVEILRDDMICDTLPKQTKREKLLLFRNLLQRKAPRTQKVPILPLLLKYLFPARAPARSLFRGNQEFANSAGSDNISAGGGLRYRRSYYPKVAFPKVVPKSAPAAGFLLWRSSRYDSQLR